MVIMLEKGPSFGEQMARGGGKALGSALVGGLEGYMQKKGREAESPYLEQIFGKGFSNIRDPKMKEIIASEMLKGQTKFNEATAKNKQEQLKHQEEQQGLLDSLDWLEDNIEYTGSTSIPGSKSFGGGILATNREAHEKREEFTKTGFWTADKIYTHFNKGTLSKEKLKVIKDDLAPRANLTERENKARVAALRRISNLPRNASKHVVDTAIERESKVIKKIEGNKSSTNNEQLDSLDSYWK